MAISIVVATLAGCAKKDRKDASSVLAASTDVIVARQGGVSSTIALSNWSAADVAVEVGGAPPSVTPLPGVQFSVPSQGVEYLNFQVGSVATPGRYSLSIHAGSAVPELRIALIVLPTGVGTNPSMAFIRTRRVDADPGGQERAVIHPATGRAFVANPRDNSVDVIDVRDRRLVASLSVPRPHSLSLLPDGDHIAVGSESERAVLVSAGSIKIDEEVSFPPCSGTTCQGFHADQIVAISSDRRLVLGRKRGVTATYLLDWDLLGNTLIDRTSEAGGVEWLAASPDGTRVLLALVGGGAMFYRADLDAFSGLAPVAAMVGTAAWRPDGAEVAIAAGLELLVVSREGAEIARRPMPGITSLAYAASGSQIYVTTAGSGLIAAFDTTRYEPAGQIALSTNLGAPVLLGVSGGTLLLGLGSGVLVADMGRVSIATTPPPSVGGIIPTAGSAVGPPPVVAVGAPVGTLASVWFGPDPAEVVHATSPFEKIQPSMGAPGPVDVTIVSADGWTSAFAEGFTYGPSIQHVEPNLAAGDGGGVLSIYGWGLEDAAFVSVGGRNAPILKGRSSSHELVVTIPPGSTGPKDIGVLTPAGATVQRGSLRYANAVRTVPLGGAPFQIVQDASGERLYVSEPDANQIEVISLWTGSRLAVLPDLNRPMGIAFLAGGSQLAVAEFEGRTIALVDVAAWKVAARYSTLDPTDMAGDPRPWSLAAAGGHLYVGFARTTLSGCFSERRGEYQVRDLAQQDGSISPVILGIECTSELTRLSSNTRGTRVAAAFIDTSEGTVVEWEPGGPATPNAWKDFLNSFSQTYNSRFVSSVAGMAVLDDAWALRRIDALASSDGLSQVGRRTSLDAVHRSGALMLAVFEHGIGVVDASGRLMQTIALPQDSVRAWDAAGISDNGRFLFTATIGGLTIVELAASPLAIGDIEPRVVPANGGAVLLHGVGFAVTSLVTVDEAPATSTFIDSGTLSVQIPAGAGRAVSLRVTNPDGTTSESLSALEYDVITARIQH